jgi:hypothetical protein
MTSPVECYSGVEYAEYPVSFEWQGVRLQIAEILARRRHPGGKSFCVRTTDDRVFELLHEEESQVWRIEPS